MFSLSVKTGWILKSPFYKGDSLISLADEPHRTRILSFEEARLFEAIKCNSQEFFLKGAVLIALDCAFRKNEIMTLKRKDINLIDKTITIRAFNSKNAKSRMVGMTSRVFKWLAQFENYEAEDDVFSIKYIQNSWERAKKRAGIAVILSLFSSFLSAQSGKKNLTTNKNARVKKNLSKKLFENPDFIAESDAFESVGCQPRRNSTNISLSLKGTN